MGFKLGNIYGKAALVKNDAFYNLSEISNGDVSDNPSEVVSNLYAIAKLYSDISEFAPSGKLDDAVMGPPITGSRNCFAVG